MPASGPYPVRTRASVHVELLHCHDEDAWLRNSPYDGVSSPNERQVERYNRGMETQLRNYVADDPLRWNDLLPVLTMAYKGQPHH